jgi:geranylgeranyl pyrophosphate synthase
VDFRENREFTFLNNLQRIADGFSAADPFINALRQSLSTNKNQESVTQSQEQFSWMELPGLCCQAAGGESEMALDINNAWGLLYTAAHMMDSIVDGDEPDAWWADFSPPAAINIATAMYAISGLFLTELFNREIPHDAVIDILGRFQCTILEMCAGQHIELSKMSLSLDDYWRIAEAKSGSFFGLACYAGARLATDDLNQLNGFFDYGFHLGTLIQISDDAKDIWSHCVYFLSFMH